MDSIISSSSHHHDTAAATSTGDVAKKEAKRKRNKATSLGPEGGWKSRVLNDLCQSRGRVEVMGP